MPVFINEIKVFLFFSLKNWKVDLWYKVTIIFIITLISTHYCYQNTQFVVRIIRNGSLCITWSPALCPEVNQRSSKHVQVWSCSLQLQAVVLQLDIFFSCLFFWFFFKKTLFKLSSFIAPNFAHIFMGTGETNVA